jgi:hypothetical protein
MMCCIGGKIKTLTQTRALSVSLPVSLTHTLSLCVRPSPCPSVSHLRYTRPLGLFIMPAQIRCNRSLQTESISLSHTLVLQTQHLHNRHIHHKQRSPSSTHHTSPSSDAGRTDGRTDRQTDTDRHTRPQEDTPTHTDTDPLGMR